MFSRQHYIKIGDMLRKDIKPIVDTNTYAIIVKKHSNLFKNDNKRFDYTRFINYCHDVD